MTNDALRDYILALDNAIEVGAAAKRDLIRDINLLQVLRDTALEDWRRRNPGRRWEE